MLNLISYASNNISARSYLYNLYLRTYKKRKYKRLHSYLKPFVKNNTDKIVDTKVHGFPAKITCGFAYPIVARTYREFNNPLLQLVYQVHGLYKRKLVLIDAGSAVGDTVFFLESNLPGIFKKICCIDGDEDFFEYLDLNMKQFDFVECYHALLSDKSQPEKSLIKIHAGTASAQGKDEILATTLDELIIKAKVEQIDILKIDVDGFDGKVLAGAERIIFKNKPFIIFEWHPLLIEKTGNRQEEVFELLSRLQYQVFLFFNKYGVFSHFMKGFDSWQLKQFTKLCLNNIFHDDWHYDVIAIPQDSAFDIIRLAECSFAKTKKSAF